MKKMIIKGGKKLSGTISINGAKNSAVALLPAAILSDEKTVIKNIPSITDIDVLEEIITLLNGKVEKDNNSLIIDSSNIINTVIPEELSNKLRASYYFMGALLAKFKHVEIYFPGGCNFGARQIDFHLKGFEALGATITTEEEKFIIHADKLIGTEINLPFASVQFIRFYYFFHKTTTTTMNSRTSSSSPKKPCTHQQLFLNAIHNQSLATTNLFSLHSGHVV